MAGFDELMAILSRPRPNGSAAEQLARQKIKEWLSGQGVQVYVQTFRGYPYYFEGIGLWLILSRTLLAAAIWLRWGWASLVIALIGLAGGTLDTLLHWPLVSWMGSRPNENILIEFGPPAETARQELVLSAHYDSKTEPLDHRKRMFFLLNLPSGILLTVLLGLLGVVDRLLLDSGSPWASFVYGMAVALTLPMLFLAWGLGLNLALGRLMPPSQGAVDNGAACAILMELARRMSQAAPLQHTRLILALYGGEEVNMQGSRAYIRSRSWPAATYAINMEAMAQDGPYVYWQRDGSVFKLQPTSMEINRLLGQAIREITGQPPIPGGPITSDGGSYLTAGIPAADLGTYHSRLIDTGFHSPADNLERVDFARLEEGVRILENVITRVEAGELNAGEQI